MKLKIKKGDSVIVLSGENKGNQGKVLKVLAEENKAIVEGVNLISKHTKPNTASPQGGIVKKEAPIHISNLMFIDKQKNPTRVGRKIENDKLVRYSKKSGEVID
ncbi:MAG: 50S ribosomal protein L24 [Bacteroidales bacterium]|nr:50S ribosomal protein L24 [Bacteroidales bacterium]